MRQMLGLVLSVHRYLIHNYTQTRRHTHMRTYHDALRRGVKADEFRVYLPPAKSRPDPCMLLGCCRQLAIDKGTALRERIAFGTFS